MSVSITEVTSMKFQNETQGPSTPVCRAKGARHTSAQDDEIMGVPGPSAQHKVMGVPGCLRYVGSEFEQIIRVLAEC
jgi:hypothetical protein